MNHSDRIIRYYYDVDRQDIDAVMALFSEDAVYERAGVEYAGKPAIEQFYRNGRLIRGEHTLDRTCYEKDASRVYVTGQFSGHGANEAPRLVRFTDVWEFDQQDKVRKRETYLAFGHAYVEK